MDLRLGAGEDPTRFASYASSAARHQAGWQPCGRSGGGGRFWGIKRKKHKKFLRRLATSRALLDWPEPFTGALLHSLLPLLGGHEWWSKNNEKIEKNSKTKQNTIFVHFQHTALRSLLASYTLSRPLEYSRTSLIPSWTLHLCPLQHLKNLKKH